VDAEGVEYSAIEADESNAAAYAKYEEKFGAV
jgi:hypothetical protein